MKVILDRLEAISKILLILGTLAGGLWAVREYFDKQHDARVAETLGYVRRFSTDPLQAAQTHIGMAWYSVKDVLRTLEETPVASPEEFANRKRQLVMSVVDKSVIPLSSSVTQRGLVPDLDLLVGFFAELQVCLDAQLCDAHVAKKYFQPYATRLYCVHEPFIVWKSKAYSQGYGDELKKLALPGASHC
ncbi:hypothetical protein NLM27_24805 [Bradyrhizobium sp. CCGB12]|uniref:hypothetical protein n=1 Tax=Bradyrhizobium sp. CCGB12 TaxID=2949632 RepID=UPI0020B18A0B|nr:hypothetical protein [Bradyrhizobium sp. CCGB12]MCP3392018.1 hypothetical protein [Bradyrhizobium sp. CCGB12]